MGLILPFGRQSAEQGRAVGREIDDGKTEEKTIHPAAEISQSDTGEEHGQKAGQNGVRPVSGPAGRGTRH